jgi:glyoxylase-like metal-dependent hydrolase (beta-lactamase superfamily II)
MTEIIQGIHWLKLPISLPDVTLAYVNAYLIRGDCGFILVDAGWNTPATLASLQKQLAETGADVKDISRIVVTHVHPDHYGLAGRLKQLSGASLAMHEIEKEVITTRYINIASLLEQTGRWLAANGVPPDELARIRDATVGMEQYVAPVHPDIILHGGETIAGGDFTFKVLWTPGHSSGHICLYEPGKRVLISGDHVLPTITSNVGSHPQSIDNPLSRYLNSLKEIKQLDVNLVLPGHESPFTGLKPRIDELIQHHEQRSAEILAAVKDGTRTAYQIAGALSWSTPGGWPDMSPFDKRLAISETLAHLEMLTAAGQTGKTTKDGLISYRKN